MKIIHRNDAIHTSDSRDAALRRLGRANRWLIAGSVVLTGVLTDVAAHAFPGHTAHPKGGAGAGRRRSSSSASALRPPAQAPQAAGQETNQRSAEAPAGGETAQGAGSEAPSAGAESATPSQQAAPSQQESAPAPEARHTEAPAAPETRETTPAPQPERSEPVVSGGS